MERVKDNDGAVHFVGVHKKTLCGRVHECNDLLGRTFILWKKTSLPITCPDCAKLYCRIKNTPWNEVDDAAMDRAMFDAVKPDETKGNEK